MKIQYLDEYALSNKRFQKEGIPITYKQGCISAMGGFFGMKTPEERVNEFIGKIKDIYSATFGVR